MENVKTTDSPKLEAEDSLISFNGLYGVPILTLKPNGVVVWNSPNMVATLSGNKDDFSILDKDVYERYQEFLATEHKSKNDRCIVFGCGNKKGEGEFIGDICVPCYEMITTGRVDQPSTNFIAQLRNTPKELITQGD